ncbi:MAG: 1-acyl-sn-glycerol-3-phosphate acyltransferase [Bacteroidales bacterium]|nr:1-acyl-sn-glycerol-3-phosphate acyltransferase [Bacteroidales bacterium]
MRGKIYENGWWYDHLRYITDAYIKASYRHLKYEGIEKIPSDGAVIYAPNHCCALMDPLAVLVLKHEPVVFVARADIFAKPAIARILNFLKIMPINRIRDGIRSVTHTAETIDKSIEVLNNGVKFCILSEGTHRPMHSLMHIGKGIARVAEGAAGTMQEGKPVYIVPVGLEYGDYFRFRTTLYARIGDPVNVTELLASMKERHEKERMDAIREAVREGLAANIVCIRDDEEYDAVWELAKISSGMIPPSRLKERFLANRAAVERIERLREESPEGAGTLIARVRTFTQRRREAGISLESLGRGKPLWRALGSSLAAIVALPFFLVAAIASLPVWLPAEIMVKSLEDKAFKNSFRCGIIIAGWTLMLPVWAAVLFCTLKWYLALAALVVLLPSPFVVYDCFSLARMVRSNWKTLFRKETRREYEELKKELEKI